MAGSQEDRGPGSPNEVQESDRPDEQQPPATPQTPDAPSVPPEGSPAPAQPEVPAAPKADWRDRRIGELTARTREMRAELERLRAQQAPNGNGAQPPTQPYAGGPPSQAAIDAQVDHLANVKAATQEFNRRCDEVAELGRRSYPDFNARVASLVGIVDGSDPQAREVYNGFLSAAMETGEAPRIIHALGGDLNEASRILSLPPLRMAVELTRMAARPVQELSQAPRPLNPAGSAALNQRTHTSPDDPNSDNLSTAEWMRRREEQVSRNSRR